MLISDLNQGRDSTLEPAYIIKIKQLQGDILEETLSAILSNYELCCSNFFNCIDLVNTAIIKGKQDLVRMGINEPIDGTDDEKRSYLRTLINYIYRRSSENGGSDKDFGNFDWNYNTLETCYDNLTQLYLIGSSDINYLECQYKILKIKYGAEASNYYEQTKENLIEKLEQSLLLMDIRYQIINEESSLLPNNRYNNYLAALDFINQN